MTWFANFLSENPYISVRFGCINRMTIRIQMDLIEEGSSYHCRISRLLLKDEFESTAAYGEKLKEFIQTMYEEIMFEKEQKQCQAKEWKKSTSLSL